MEMTAELQCHSGLELPMRDTVVAERQASAGARDGVKGKRNDLAARAPLHALVRPPVVDHRSSHLRCAGLGVSVS